MLKLDIDLKMKERARDAAANIAGSFDWLFGGYSSLAIERTVLRLLGVDGALEDGKPLPNVVVDHLQTIGGMGKGAAIPVANAMLAKKMDVMEVAQAVGRGELDLDKIPPQDPQAVFDVLNTLADKMLSHIRAQRDTRKAMFA